MKHDKNNQKTTRLSRSGLHPLDLTIGNLRLMVIRAKQEGNAELARQHAADAAALMDFRDLVARGNFDVACAAAREMNSRVCEQILLWMHGQLQQAIAAPQSSAAGLVRRRRDRHEVNREFLRIAQDVCAIETLAERGRDALDFHHLSVRQIAALLNAAYELGRDSE